MKQKFQRTQFFMVVGFVLLLTSFFSCNLEKDKKTDEEIKNKAIAITRIISKG